MYVRLLFGFLVSLSFYGKKDTHAEATYTRNVHACQRKSAGCCGNRMAPMRRTFWMICNKA